MNKKWTPIEPWMTTKLLEKRRLMNITRKRFFKKRNEINETKYRLLKKEYNCDIRKAKNDYYGEEFFKAQKNSKKVWQIINKIIHGKSKSQPIEQIRVNDVLINDDKEIAEIFSNYYKFAAIKKVNEIKSDIDFQEFLSTKDKRT